LKISKNCSRKSHNFQKFSIIWESPFSNLWLELEKIVRPGKVPASCQEHADRGETKNGKYQIKPNLDIQPFYVTCDFRKCYPNFCTNFNQMFEKKAKHVLERRKKSKKFR